MDFDIGIVPQTAVRFILLAWRMHRRRWLRSPGTWRSWGYKPYKYDLSKVVTLGYIHLCEQREHLMPQSFPSSAYGSMISARRLTTSALSIVQVASREIHPTTTSSAGKLQHQYAVDNPSGTSRQQKSTMDASSILLFCHSLRL